MANTRLLLVLAACLVSLVHGGVLQPRQATTNSPSSISSSCQPAGIACPEECGYPIWICEAAGCLGESGGDLGDSAGICQNATQKGCCCDVGYGWYGDPYWSTCTPSRHTSTSLSSTASTFSFFRPGDPGTTTASNSIWTSTITYNNPDTTTIVTTWVSTTITVSASATESTIVTALPGSLSTPTVSYSIWTSTITYSIPDPTTVVTTWVSTTLTVSASVTESTVVTALPGSLSTPTASNSISTSTIASNSPGTTPIVTTWVSTTITVSASVTDSTIATALPGSGTATQSAGSSGSTLEQPTLSGGTSASASSPSLPSSSTETWEVVTSNLVTIITLASPTATAATLTWFMPTTISITSPTDTLVTLSLPPWTFTSDAGGSPVPFTTTPTTVISLPSPTPTVMTLSWPVPTVVTFSASTDTLLTVTGPPVVTSTPESGGDGFSTTTSTSTSVGGGGGGSPTRNSPPGGGSPTASPGSSSPASNASPTATNSESTTSAAAATSTTYPTTTETSTSTMTYTEQGYTLTAEWDVRRLPEYSHLRGRKKKKKHDKSIGPPWWSLEYIFAGGWQFFRRLPPMPPIGFPRPPGPPPSNVAPVIDVNPPMPPTPDPPSGPGTDPNEDAEDCPDPEPKCSSPRCAGDRDLEMCSLPPLTGCGCEPGDCPEVQPLCSDCDGKDGKCTSGDYEGCECAEECPEGIHTLHCDDCGGAGADWNICAGRKDLDPNKDGRYKGCKCTPLSPQKGFPKPSDPEITTSDWMDHLAMWEDDYSTGSVAPNCQRAIIKAPQRASDNADLNVVDSISEFCSEHSMKTLASPEDGYTPLVETQDIVSSMYAMSENQSFWLSANMLDPDAQTGCGANATMATHECVRMLTFAMEYCDPHSGDTHGASIVTDCIAYNITLDVDEDQTASSPPWSEEDREWSRGKCIADSGGEVHANTWEAIYPEFCKYQSDPQRNFTMQDQIEFQYAWLQGSNPLPVRFGFRFVPNPVGGTCRLTCSEAHDTLAKGTCGNSQGQGIMVTRGGIDVGCGRYYYTIQGLTGDEVRCLVDDYAYVGVDQSHPVRPSKSYLKKDARIAIGIFCRGFDILEDDDDGVEAQMTMGMVVDPNASHAPDGWRNQTTVYPERLIFFPKTLQIITVSAAFASVVGRANQHPSWGSQYDFPTNENCNPNEAMSFYVADYAGKCIDTITKSLDLCNVGETVDYFSGGYTVQHDAPHGCVIWKLYAYDTDVDTDSVPLCVKEQKCLTIRRDGSLAHNATHEEVAALVKEYYPHLRGG